MHKREEESAHGEAHDVLGVEDVLGQAHRDLVEEVRAEGRERRAEDLRDKVAKMLGRSESIRNLRLASPDVRERDGGVEVRLRNLSADVDERGVREADGLGQARLRRVIREREDADEEERADELGDQTWARRSEAVQKVLLGAVHVVEDEGRERARDELPADHA